MRITGGEYRGKKIQFLKSFSSRPLKDLVKESIFNLIIHSKFIDIELTNTAVLDLYSGIGSFGIECISRGANEITFVEKDIEAIKLLTINLESLKILKKANIYNEDISIAISKIQNKKFEIVFFDPPFADINYTKHLRAIKNLNLVKEKHLIIIHRDRKTNDKLDDVLKTIMVKNYGRSKIIFATFA